MPHRWLPLFTLTFLTVIVFIFFVIRLRPIETRRAETTTVLTPLAEPTVTFVNPSFGASEPKITIVEFADFECSACGQLTPTLDAIVKAYPKEVRVVWKNLPNSSAHDQAIPAAIAAHCADRQGKFWNYHDLLFARMSILSDDQYTQIANELSLDLSRFKTCVKSKDTFPIIQKDIEEATALGLIATPTLFVGKEKEVGAIGIEELIRVVQSQLETN